MYYSPSQGYIRGLILTPVRPGSTHAFVGESTRREGRFHVSASTKALFAPLPPPGGLKFPSYCRVPSYCHVLLFAASCRVGTLVKMASLDIFISYETMLTAFAFSEIKGNLGDSENSVSDPKR